MDSELNVWTESMQHIIQAHIIFHEETLQKNSSSYDVKGLSAVHLFLAENQLNEAATSECKHQLAESTNSHCYPVPTG